MPIALRTRLCTVAPTEGQIQETLVVRDGQVIAVLPEGDPLLYLLRLPARRLRTMRRKLEPVLEKRHFERKVFEAILEYREGRLARRVAGSLAS
jgi:hypothetical protein